MRLELTPRPKPRPATKRKIKSILLKKYELYLSTRFAAGQRAAECRNILAIAAEEGVELPLEVTVGCKFWALLDDAVSAQRPAEIEQPRLLDAA